MQTPPKAIHTQDAPQRAHERQWNLPDPQHHAHIVVHFESLTKDVLPRLEDMSQLIPGVDISYEGSAELPQPSAEGLQRREEMGMTQVHHAVCLKRLDQGCEAHQLKAILEVIKVILDPVEIRPDLLTDQASSENHGAIGQKAALLTSFEMPNEETKPASGNKGEEDGKKKVHPQEGKKAPQTPTQ